MTDELQDAGATAWLARLDSFAHQLIGWNHHLRLEVAQTEAARQAAYRLRYQEVIERGWAQPADFPDQMEHDEYDDAACQIVVWKHDTLVATARLVFPTLIRLLPVETAFNLVIEPRHQVVYFSRVVIAPGYRMRGIRELLLGILGIGWLEVRQRGFSKLCGAMAESVMPIFRKVGLDVTPLGTSRPFHGEMRYAVYIDMEKTAQRLSELYAGVLVIE